MNRLSKGWVMVIAGFLLSVSARADYREIEVTDGGTVKGKVRIGDARPLTLTYTIRRHREVCGTGIREVPIVKANGDALQDAVVFLDDVQTGKRFPAGLKKITINQKNCAFDPYFSVLADGGELEPINSDPTLHNIHVYELFGVARRTVLNVSQPEKGNIVTKKIKMEKGHGLKVECDAHPFMHAFVFVARNPYFSVVDEEGAFEIRDVPPGRYAIKVWHGILGLREGTVEVTADATARVSLAY